MTIVSGAFADIKNILCSSTITAAVWFISGDLGVFGVNQVETF